MLRHKPLEDYWISCVAVPPSNTSQACRAGSIIHEGNIYCLFVYETEML